MSGFDDLEDDLPQAVAAPARPTVFVENCSKCGGSGQWRAPTSLGHHYCTQCKGTGKQTFKTSKEDREKARLKAREAKASRIAKKQDFNLNKFAENHPKIAAWWTGSDFAFAVSLRDQVARYGRLSDKQLDAAYKCVDKLQQMRDNSAKRAAEAKEIDIKVIEDVFNTALGKGFKRPALRLAGFRFSPAPATGRNAGSIYVQATDDEKTYLGKVTNGRFFKSGACTAEQETVIVDVAGHPKDAAVAFGRRTGCCSVCGRQLDNKESIDRGIGPICAEKFGW